MLTLRVLRNDLPDAGSDVRVEGLPELPRASLQRRKRPVRGPRALVLRCMAAEHVHDAWRPDAANFTSLSEDLEQSNFEILWGDCLLTCDLWVVIIKPPRGHN